MYLSAEQVKLYPNVVTRGPAVYRRIVKLYTVLVLMLATSTASAHLSPAQMKDSLQKATNDESRLQWYQNLFQYYQHTHTDSALYYIDKGIQDFQASGYITGLATMLHMQAVVYNDELHNYTKATARATAALKLYVAARNWHRAGEMYNVLGGIEMGRSNYTTATSYFIIALRILEQVRDTAGIAGAYINLGCVYSNLNEQDKALDYLQKALSLLEHSSNVEDKINVLNNLGSIYLAKHEEAKAIFHIESALYLATGPRYKSFRVSPLINLGQLYEDKNPDKALRYYQEALTLATQQQSTEQEINAMLFIGAIKAKDDPQYALAIYKHALQLAKKTETPGNDLVTLFSAMTDIYRDQKDYKNALELTEQRQALQDSLFNMEKIREIANLESVYKLGKANSQVNDLELSRKSEIQQKLMISLIAVVLTTLLTMIVFSYRGSIRLNRQLERSMTDLKASEEKLRISNNLKERYYSLLSHDLKSPLKYMALTLETLKDNVHQYGPAVIERQLQGLHQSTDMVYGLTESFISWIRANDTSLKVKPATVNITGLLNSLKAIYEHMEHTRINIDAGQNLLFYTDPDLMHIILRNVVDNALKHGHANTIQITAQEKTDHTLQLSIQNDGCCIPAETLAGLNDCDLTADIHTVDNQQSLGFQVIKALTTKLNGTYHLNSTKENGTEINFTFTSLKF